MKSKVCGFSGEQSATAIASSCAMVLAGVLAVAPARAADGIGTWLTPEITDSNYDPGGQIISLTTKYTGASDLDLSTAYVEHFPDPLAPPGSGHFDEAFWGIQAKTDGGAALGTIRTEAGYGGFSADTGEGFGNADHHFLRVETNTQSRFLRYGATLQSAGTQFYRPGADIAADRETAEFWMAKTWQKLRVRSYVNQAYDNLDKDPSRARLTDTRVGTKAEYTLRHWPYLGYVVDYAMGMRQSNLEPTGYDPIDAATHTARMSLHYKSARWTSTLSSIYLTQHDDGGTLANDSEQATQQMSGTLRLSSSVSLQPGVSASVARNAADPEIATQRTWINLRYQPAWQPLQVSSYLSQWQRDDGLAQSQEQRHGVELTARWRSANLPTRSNLYLRVAYDNRWQTTADVSTHTEDVTFWLGWHTPLSGFSPLSERAARLGGADPG